MLVAVNIVPFAIFAIRHLCRAIIAIVVGMLGLSLTADLDAQSTKQQRATPDYQDAEAPIKNTCQLDHLPYLSFYLNLSIILSRLRTLFDAFCCRSFSADKLGLIPCFLQKTISSSESSKDRDIIPSST